MHGSEHQKLIYQILVSSRSKFEMYIKKLSKIKLVFVFADLQLTKEIYLKNLIKLKLELSKINTPFEDRRSNLIDSEAAFDFINCAKFDNKKIYNFFFRKVIINSQLLKKEFLFFPSKISQLSLNRNSYAFEPKCKSGNSKIYVEVNN
ncbi:hypothetical protein BpHYR1_050267 [Brachionus plicatilis]|uniref:Uncharacterized protein n=1 Tax=Brachionus plicatilis TaxID=10195 RepID=A0A3M7RVW8_BRAPC|nr:hypothetical protein BpHYR1_050267 [Brachionus plicatilis]